MIQALTVTEKKATLRTFYKYLLPCMLGMALVAIYAFTDTFVVGRKYGAIALGAMGICTPIMTITYALGFMFGIGGGSLYSIYRGKKDEKQANSFFTTAAVSTLVLGFIIAVVGNIYISEFAFFLGADSENIEYVIPYLRCLLIYIPGFMFDQLMNSFIRNDGHPNVAMTAVTVGTALNVILDFLFVFGFDWGMFGAAFATCLCSFINICINVGYCKWKKSNLAIRIRNYDFRKVWRIVRNGFSVFVLEASAGIVTFVFIHQAINLYGTIGASIYTVIMNWTLVTVNMVLGITQASQPLISLSFGAGEYSKMYLYRKYSIVSGIALGIIYVLIGYGFTDILVTIFTNDSVELVTETVKALRLYLPAYLIMGVGICIGIYYQSIESAAKSMTLMLLRGIALPIAGAVFLAMAFGTTGLWITVPLAELITAIVGIVFIIKEKSLEADMAPAQAVRKKNCNIVITISRQYGSGGREIGRRIAQRLGIPLYDKEVNEMTSSLGEYDYLEVAGNEDRRFMPPGLFCKHHYCPITNDIFITQCEAIEHFAEKGSCVIVGRCAEYVLSGKYPLINIFVHAPLSERIKRVALYEKCSESKAALLIRESDTARAEYHDFFTNTEWGKIDNYDLTLNSSLGIDACADTVVLFIKSQTAETIWSIKKALMTPHTVVSTPTTEKLGNELNTGDYGMELGRYS